MNDLDDIEGQLTAIDEWLGTLEDRCHDDHSGMCTKELAQARSRLASCRKQLGARRAELYRLAKN